MDQEQKQKFMKEALLEARKCEESRDVPIGCVVVYDGEIVGRGKNSRERFNMATAHAEVLAIDEACKTLGTRRLEKCQIFITLEPCPMCAGAIMLSRIENIYIGALDFLTGACGSKINIFEFSMSPKPKIEYGILKDECKSLLNDFFKELRVEN